MNRHMWIALLLTLTGCASAPSSNHTSWAELAESATPIIDEGPCGPRVRWIKVLARAGAEELRAVGLGKVAGDGPDTLIRASVEIARDCGEETP